MKGQIQNVIPTQGGKHMFASMQKKHKTCSAHSLEKTSKVNESFGNFQKWMFSTSITAEVLKKLQNAFPPSMGIKQKYASHRAWGSQFQLFEHPPSENGKSEKRTLQALTAIAAFWQTRNSNMVLEGLKK